MASKTEVKTGEDTQQPSPLKLSRVFHARRETVFKAWSTADHVKRWFSPQTYTVPEARVQMHVGGPFEVCMRSPAGEEHWTRGTFAEVLPDTRLVIDMYATNDTGERLFRAYTEVDFSDALGGTKWTSCRHILSSIYRPPRQWWPARLKGGVPPSISWRKKFCACPAQRRQASVRWSTPLFI